MSKYSAVRGMHPGRVFRVPVVSPQPDNPAICATSATADARCIWEVGEFRSIYTEDVVGSIPAGLTEDRTPTLASSAASGLLTGSDEDTAVASAIVSALQLVTVDRWAHGSRPERLQRGMSRQGVVPVGEHHGHGRQRRRHRTGERQR